MAADLVGLAVKSIAPTCRDGKAYIYGSKQPQYEPLPARLLGGREGIVVTEWQLTEEERALIARGENIRLAVMTFGEHLQPVHLEITTPEGE